MGFYESHDPTSSVKALKEQTSDSYRNITKTILIMKYWCIGVFTIVCSAKFMFYFTCTEMFQFKNKK